MFWYTLNSWVSYEKKRPFTIKFFFFVQSKPCRKKNQQNADISQVSLEDEVKHFQEIFKLICKWKTILKTLAQDWFAEQLVILSAWRGQATEPGTHMQENTKLISRQSAHRYMTHRHVQCGHRAQWNITMAFCGVTKPSKLSFLLIRQTSWRASFHRQDGQCQVPGTRHQQRTCSQWQAKEKNKELSLHMISTSLWKLHHVS